MKYVIGIIIVALVVIGGYYLVEKGKPSEIKIGISAPLTGEAASLGEGFAAGAELAAQEINEAGGINGIPVKLVIEDDECSPKGVNAITKLVSIDKVVAIVGPLCSAAAGPGLPTAQEKGVPVIVVGSAPHLTAIGDYIFRNYPSDAFQGKFAAEYVFEKMEKRNVAVIYVKNDWGEGIQEVFGERLAELGGEVVFNEGVSQDSTDVRTVISKAKEENPDAIYIPLYPATGIAAIKQIKESGLSVPIIGGDAFAGEEVWKVPEAEGVLYTVAKTDNPEEFQSKIKEATGKTANVYSPFAYDGVKIFAEIIGEVGTDRAKIQEAMETLEYEDAVAVPLVSFDEQGDLKSADFEVMVIKGGKAEKMIEE